MISLLNRNPIDIAESTRMLLLPSRIFKIRDLIENLSVVRGRAGGPLSNIRSAISCRRRVY